MTIYLYAALLGLVYLYLSVRTLRVRRKLRIAVGDGGNVDMLRAMRAHANFSEYVPLALLILFFIESSQASKWMVHMGGIALTTGRILHAYGVSQVDEKFQYRVSGMGLTLTTIGLGCLYLLMLSFYGIAG